MLDNTNDTNSNTPATPAVLPVVKTDGRDTLIAGDYVSANIDDRFAPDQVSVERDYAATEVIKPRSRDQYVNLFKYTEKRTAIATLQMCRVVYEAKKSLDECDFSDFCKAIGYTDESSAIRKYCSIGKVQPRLVQYAKQLPSEWSKIYMVTQIPARTFEDLANDSYDFRNLKGKELADLVRATRVEQSIEKMLPRDKDSREFVVAKILFTKPIVDAYDWRAIKKALAEVESRLPIRVLFAAAADAVYEKTKTSRYNEAKKSARDVEFQPSKWDYGTEASQSNWETPAAKPAADFEA
jgi:hypothetical protein